MTMPPTVAALEAFDSWFKSYLADLPQSQPDPPPTARALFEISFLAGWQRCAGHLTSAIGLLLLGDER